MLADDRVAAQTPTGTTISLYMLVECKNVDFFSEACLLRLGFECLELIAKCLASLSVFPLRFLSNRSLILGRRVVGWGGGARINNDDSLDCAVSTLDY